MTHSIGGDGLYLMFSPTSVLSYVGQIGRSFFVRMWEHRKALRCDFGKYGGIHHQLLGYQFIRKHGVDCFVQIPLLGVCGSSFELRLLESQVIPAWHIQLNCPHVWLHVGK